MSRFSKYATAVDNAAKQAFKRYREAAKVLSWAEQTRNATPRKSGASAEDNARAAKAEAVYLEAVQDVKKAQRGILAAVEQLAPLRAKLAADLEAAYSVDPAQVDGNALELLKSGVMRPHEYERLYNEAAKGGNITMCRLVGKYADSAAGELGTSPESAKLRVLSDRAKSLDGSDHLAAFDYLTDCLRRCSDNPGMIDHWEELTENTINAF